MKKTTFDIQNHASYSGSDNTARSYQKEFKGLLEAVFGVQSYFGDFFVGGIDALDGVQDNATAFTIKTTDIPCVIKDGTVGESGTPAYNRGANVAFGTGTGSSTRFGNRTEVIFGDTDVKYTWDWVFHEGIDRNTVNNDFDAAVASRLDLQAQEKVAMFNAHHSAFIAGCVDSSATIGRGTKSITEVFNELSKYFTNSNLRKGVTKIAKVSPDVYSLIVDSNLMTTAKGSTVNIDRNEVNMFKGFVIEELPDDAFQAGDEVYAYAAGIGKAFTGINTARTIESEDFDGVALQGAGLAGEFVLPANKKAVAKVTTAAVA